ncbi:Cu,Zn superoxide dismutase-like protein [Rhizoclosmatium globosum]|uniref:Cu,Zn superoxide dismutase-like protein n=1 Tax=Rhizoclosmatium globosum TaxID=329046 RepID=A0A1Y2CDL6_9FUNG|nr:Cu,Zn superoxide dismutase-like protein [Rhizoclosmatium globosum]|eukprot:ORY45122.1 Cu,Zn superoxide dismutase-like protein [Rhizoclosmatium globosum]
MANTTTTDRDSDRDGTILATAILTPTLNSKVQGQVTFTLTEAGVGVSVEATVSNLGPGTSHGFHIHAFGDTSSETGLAMAGHFNPTNANHGCPASLAVPHAFHFGDLGSVVADEGGNAVRKWVSRDLAVLDPAQLGFVLGRGVIVHEKDDDCMTQPTGAFLDVVLQ